MSWVAFVGLVLALATRSIFFAVISVLSMEFDLLKKDFVELKYKPKYEWKRGAEKLVDRQNTLLNVRNNLQKIYEISLLYIFFISSVIMCNVSFQLSISKDILDAFSFLIPYMSVMGGQVLLICVFGQKLIDSSCSVQDGVYDSGREKIDDKKLKRQLVLVILRTQHSHALTAMGFAEILLESFATVNFLNFIISSQFFLFLQILSATYSYYSLMKTLYVE